MGQQRLGPCTLLHADRKYFADAADRLPRNASARARDNKMTIRPSEMISIASPIEIHLVEDRASVKYRARDIALKCRSEKNASIARDFKRQRQR